MVLIKSVLNNLPIYYLSIFKMPKAVAQRIINMQRKFFWCSESSQRGFPLVAWETIQRPKELGCLGVGDLVIKNAALLFKWWWRYSDRGKPLWKRIVFSNHGTDLDAHFLSHPPPNLGSTWSQILHFSSFGDTCHELIQQGLRKNVGCGNYTKFWLELWIGDEILKQKYPKLFSISN